MPTHAYIHVLHLTLCGFCSLSIVLPALYSCSEVETKRDPVSKPQCSLRNTKTSAKSKNQAILRAVHLPDKMQFTNSPLPQKIVLCRKWKPALRQNSKFRSVPINRSLNTGTKTGMPHFIGCCAKGPSTLAIVFHGHSSHLNVTKGDICIYKHSLRYSASFHGFFSMFDSRSCPLLQNTRTTHACNTWRITLRYTSCGTHCSFL